MCNGCGLCFVPGTGTDGLGGKTCPDGSVGGKKNGGGNDTSPAPAPDPASDPDPASAPDPTSVPDPASVPGQPPAPTTSAKLTAAYKKLTDAQNQFERDKETMSEGGQLEKQKEIDALRSEVEAIVAQENSGAVTTTAATGIVAAAVALAVCVV